MTRMTRDETGIIVHKAITSCTKNGKVDCIDVMNHIIGLHPDFIGTCYLSPSSLRDINDGRDQFEHVKTYVVRDRIKSRKNEFRHIGNCVFEVLGAIDDCDEVIEEQPIESTIDDGSELSGMTRKEKTAVAEESWSVIDEFRAETFKRCASAYTKLTGGNLSFERDHARTMDEHSGTVDELKATHHADNFQLLIKNHNGIKNYRSTSRMTIERQIAYIERQFEDCVDFIDGFEITDELRNSLDMIHAQLRSVY